MCKKKNGFTSNISFCHRFAYHRSNVCRLSLVLCKGKEDIERKNSFISGSSSEDLPSSVSTPSLYRRLAQTEADTELVAPTTTEEVIQASIIETQANAQELEEKAKVRLRNFLLKKSTMNLFRPLNLKVQKSMQVALIEQLYRNRRN